MFQPNLRFRGRVLPSGYNGFYFVPIILQDRLEDYLTVPRCSLVLVLALCHLAPRLRMWLPFLMHRCRTQRNTSGFLALRMPLGGAAQPPLDCSTSIQGHRPPLTPNRHGKNRSQASHGTATGPLGLCAATAGRPSVVPPCWSSTGPPRSLVLSRLWYLLRIA